MDQKQTKYRKCEKCNRSIPERFGRFLNEGFLCNNHKITYNTTIRFKYCARCNKPVLSYLTTSINNQPVCNHCLYPTTIRFKRPRLGANIDEHKRRQRTRLLKRHKHK